jgi:Glycosyl transferase family group 2
MSRLSVASTIALSAVVVRQTFVLSAIVRSRRFLRGAPAARPATAVKEPVTPAFFIVLPVLREAAILREAVAHFRAVTRGYAAQVIVVTTAREAAEAHRLAPGSDTVALSDELARQGRCIHLHYPDPRGLKADQLNYAAAYCVTALPSGISPAQAFLVCYDADSRPPQESLACFARAITENPDADVFHQSSRFEARAPRPDGGGLLTWLCLTVCDAGALRANRFVLGFEIPRLINRSPRVSAIKRAACSGVYAHVTGHGLCVRLSLLERLPFPARSPLEDMHYSFILGSRNLPMMAVPSLDSAEVPDSVTAQLQQAARWFFGPARFARYLKDPATLRGWRARAMAASAFGSAAEWLACAVTPALLAILVAVGSRPVRSAAGTCIAICCTQLVVTEVWLGAPARVCARLARVIAFPLACTVHGVGGIVGAARLIAGGSGTGKTERSSAGR